MRIMIVCLVSLSYLLSCLDTRLAHGMDFNVTIATL